MKSIICGAGDVGYSIADKLSKEGFEVIVVDDSQERLKKVSESLDVKTIIGVPSLPSTLAKADAKDCDILIAINSCERDKADLEFLKKSEFYENLEKDHHIGIIEFYRGSDKVELIGSKLMLPGEERYDKLHIKSYDMIKWCVENLTFNRLVKLDCNFMTYSNVGERTRQKICGLDRVEKAIFKRKFEPYTGSNGRPFLVKDF